MRTPRTIVAVAVGMALTLSWALLLDGIHTELQIGDVITYERYARYIADGMAPYLDFPLEYPPGALPAFWLPTIAGSYFDAFAHLMWACGAATVALVALTLTRVSAHPRRLYAGVAFAALAPLALGSVTLARYDLFPAMLTVAALLALVASKPRIGLGLLALGAAVKLYPLVLVPIALVFVRREWGRREAGLALATFAIVLLLAVGPFLVLAPGGLLDSVQSQAGRELQVESLGAGVLLLAHQLGAYTPTGTSSLHSTSLAGSLPDALGIALTVVEGLAVLAAWVLYARGEGGRERLLLASAAAVTAFVAFGKVLSPQYLLWLIPLVALVGGRRGLVAAGLLGVASLLTRVLFQDEYLAVVAFQPASLLVPARDVLLVATYAVLLGGLRTRPCTGNRLMRTYVRYGRFRPLPAIRAAGGAGGPGGAAL